MPLVVDSILRLKFITVDERAAGSRFVNILHYRCSAGSLSEDNFTQIKDAWLTTVWARWKECLYNSTTPLEMRLQTVWEAAQYEVVFADADWGAGELVLSGNAPPQAAACITRRSYKAGRKGIGRIMFGPLPWSYTESGQVLRDPVGVPNLDQVLDAAGDPLTAGGCTLKPCVVPAKITADPTSLADIRTQGFARNVVFLKSRRIGQGS